MTVLIQKESGGNFNAMAAQTNDGTNKVYSTTNIDVWSNHRDRKPVIRPDGVLTGLLVTPTTSNNQIKISAGTANIGGQKRDLSAVASVAITRPTGSNVLITSIHMDSAGSATALAGTTGSSFSETRGSAGGPPLIPVGEIELAQVRLSSSTAAVILTSEIRSSVNVHREDANFPAPKTESDNGRVTFTQAIMQNHTGNVTKAIWAEFYEPVFEDLPASRDSVLPTQSVSVSSEEFYGESRASRSRQLAAGSLVVAIDGNAVRNPLAADDGQFLTFRMFPDDGDMDAYWQYQGETSVVPTIPTSGVPTYALTVVADRKAKRVVN